MGNYIYNTKSKSMTYARFNKLHKVLSISIICLSLILCRAFYGVPLAAMLSTLLLVCNIVYTSNKHKIVPTTFSFILIYVVSYIVIEISTYVAVTYLVHIIAVRYNLTELLRMRNQVAMVVYMVFVSIVHIYYYLNDDIYEVFGLEASSLYHSDSDYFLLGELLGYEEKHRYLIQLIRRLFVHLAVPVMFVTVSMLSKNIGYMKYVYVVIAALCCKVIIMLCINKQGGVNEHKSKKGI